MQELCVLILYPATTLNSLIQPSSLLVASLGFSMHSIMSSANSDSFISYFPIWILFISFSSLIAMTRTFKTVLNQSDYSWHPCLIPGLRGNAFSFSLLNMILTVHLSCKVFIVLREVTPYAHFLESFYHKWVLNFIKRFFCSYWGNHKVFILQFVSVVYWRVSEE